MNENIYIVGAKILNSEHENTIDEYVREDELNKVINSYEHTINCLFEGEKWFESITKVKKMDYDKIGDAYIILDTAQAIILGLVDSGIVDSIDLEIKDYFKNPTEEENKKLEGKYFRIINQMELVGDMLKDYSDTLFDFIDAMRYIRLRDEENQKSIAS